MRASTPLKSLGGTGCHVARGRAPHRRHQRAQVLGRVAHPPRRRHDHVRRGWRHPPPTSTARASRMPETVRSSTSGRQASSNTASPSDRCESHSARWRRGRRANAAATRGPRKGTSRFCTLGRLLNWLEQCRQPLDLALQADRGRADHRHLLCGMLRDRVANRGAVDHHAERGDDRQRRQRTQVDRAGDGRRRRRGCHRDGHYSPSEATGRETLTACGR